MFKTIKGVAFATYKEWAAYRSHILVSLFLGPVHFLVQYYIWSSVYTGQQVLNGFNLEEMLVYYGITTLINYCIMDFAGWNLQMLIRTGKFVTFILRPVSHRLFAFAQKIGHRLLGFWLELVPIYIVFLLVFDIYLIPERIIWAFISILLGFIMMFLVNYCIGITGFWLTRTEGIRSIFLVFRDVFAGVFIPLTFFPGVIQKILFFLPFQFISYVPVRVFIGDYELAGLEFSLPQIVGIQAVYVVIMLLFSELLWRKGIRKFTGVGT
ncbi:MAG: ABC transporter permease [Halanaerobiales bacterium]